MPFLCNDHDDVQLFKTLSFLALLGKILDIEIQMPQILKVDFENGLFTIQKFSLNLFKETEGEPPNKFHNINKGQKED